MINFGTVTVTQVIQKRVSKGSATPLSQGGGAASHNTNLGTSYMRAHIEMQQPNFCTAIKLDARDFLHGCPRMLTHDLCVVRSYTSSTCFILMQGAYGSLNFSANISSPGKFLKRTRSLGVFELVLYILLS